MTLSRRIAKLYHKISSIEELMYSDDYSYIHNRRLYINPVALQKVRSFLKDHKETYRELHSYLSDVTLFGRDNIGNLNIKALEKLAERYAVISNKVDIFR